MGLIHKTNSKITKAKQLQFYVINQCHNKQNLHVFLHYSCVPTMSQATNQSMMCTCGSMCTLWGLMTGTGVTFIKRHKQQAFASGPNMLQWLLFLSQLLLSGNYISMWMTWHGLAGWDVYREPTFLWVGSVIFKLHMAVCGRPFGVLGSLRKERRPHGSWPMSLICRG